MVDFLPLKGTSAEMKLTMQESVVQIGSAVDKLIVRSDEIVRPLSVPLRQLILLCFQKIHDNLTVGC